MKVIFSYLIRNYKPLLRYHFDNQEEAVNKAIRMVVLNKRPVSIIPIINVLAEFYFKHILSLFLHPGFHEFYLLMYNTGQLTSIDPKTFNGLTNLIWLILNDNQISRIESQTFNYLKNLRYLLLQTNSIISIPSTVFLGLTNLLEVYLKENPVYEIYGQEYLQSLCDPNPLCRVY